MSKITNDAAKPGLAQDALYLYLPIWQQWASRGLNQVEEGAVTVDPVFIRSPMKPVWRRVTSVSK